LQSVAGTLAPIFEKFQAREKLLTSELKYRGLVENSNDGILILQDEDIVFTNAKMADLLLVSRDKLIDTPFVNYLPDEEKEKIRLRHKNRLLGHYEPAIYESTILQSNGEKVPVEINASLSHDINKKPAQVIIVRDLRERKKEEEARTNLLIQSEKLKSLNTMATSVAHNFNNSLQTILGSLELVMQEMDTENPASKILQMAKNSADKAQDMGKLMLTYVGYNTGSYSKFNINNLLQTEFEFYQKKFPNISMTITLQENALMLRCNESQIRQVIQNIFNNAGEALEDSNGEIQVCCRLEHCTPETSKYNFMEKPYPKKCISLKIFDTGMGMESTIIERIFDPYFTTKFTGRG
ncbi:MAG: PAS domain S-box protein, partial [Candidatus Marinimicrobia bacterium]|nr:PAS domain S-box protein [Candidatus Neomarinimicrobiota bacterium]